MSNYLGFQPSGHPDYFFVSYNSEDANRVGPVTCVLSNAGIPLWYDYGLEYGEKWEARIAERICNSKAVILFFTKGILSKNNSFVQKEYRIASKGYKKKIYVVLMDDIDSRDVPYDKMVWWMDIMDLQCINAYAVPDISKTAEMISSAIGEELHVKNQITAGHKDEKEHGSGIAVSGKSRTSSAIPEYDFEINENEATIIGCGRSVESLIIPEKIAGYTVTKIANGAFYGRTALKSIVLPSKIEKIGLHAFSGCTNLTDITLPPKITDIDTGCFKNCSSLAHITLPEEVKSISCFAFEGCTALTEITIPSGATSILVHAFRNCTGLKDVYFTGDYTKSLLWGDIFSSDMNFTVHYPRYNRTWSFYIQKNYGAGSIKWLPWKPGTSS